MDWFEEIHAAGTGIWWGISGPAPGAPLIGAYGLNDIRAEHRRGELGYWLLPECWAGNRHGVARRTARARLGPDGPAPRRRRGEVREPGDRRLLDPARVPAEGIRRLRAQHGSFIDLMMYARLAPMR